MEKKEEEEENEGKIMRVEDKNMTSLSRSPFTNFKKASQQARKLIQKIVPSLQNVNNTNI